MTTEETFATLVAHLREGVVMHDQMSALYNFLNLSLYEKWHKNQFYEENENCKDIRNFYLQTYCKILKETSVEEVKLIPDNWYKYSKKDVDTSTKRSTVKELMKKWVEWEESTCKLLQSCYKELDNGGEIYAAARILKSLKEVEKELEHARTEYLNLEAVGYDIVHIIERQEGGN